jgi:hypothetical protein
VSPRSRPMTKRFRGHVWINILSSLSPCVETRQIPQPTWAHSRKICRSELPAKGTQIDVQGQELGTGALEAHAACHCIVTFTIIMGI